MASERASILACLNHHARDCSDRAGRALYELGRHPGIYPGRREQLAVHGLDKGAVYAVSESFPLLLMIGYCVLARRQRFLASWAMLALVLVIYLVLTMLFGGLRGARSNTVWAIFWAVGMIHFFVRPVPKKIIFAGAVFLFGFMYVYGFFKSGGLKAITALESGQVNIEYLEHKTQRTTAVVLLGDLREQRHKRLCYGNSITTN